MSLLKEKPCDGGSKGEVENDNEENLQRWITDQLETINIRSNDPQYEKWVCSRNKRKRSRRKKDVNMEAKRVKRWQENTEEWQKQLNSKENIKIIQSKQETKKKEKLDEEKMQWYGDELTRSRSWPDRTNDNIIRIYGQNINGISRYTEYNEWEIMLDELHKQQIDIACLTELNLDVNKAKVKYKLTEQAKNLDKNCSLIMATSKSKLTESDSKRGGTLILT